MKAMILEDKKLLTFKEVEEPKDFGEKPILVHIAIPRQIF
jgi:hypothetical protein